MLFNYIKTALRMLMRNPFFGIINVAGLAVGFAVFFVLWPFTISELRSDKFVKDHERISRILFDWNWSEDGGKSWGHLIIGGELAHISKELHDQNLIEDFTRLIAQPHFYDYATSGLKDNLVVTVERKDKNLYAIREENAVCVDKNFFDFFDLAFVAGDRRTALENPGSIVISERNAIRIFGQHPAPGQWIKVNGANFSVMGIFRDLPTNSHLRFDMAFSNTANVNVWNQRDYNMPWAMQYCKLKNSDDDLTAILAKNFDHLMGWFMKLNPHVKGHLESQPFSEIVFSENYNSDTFQSKSRFSLHVLATVSIAVLIMAWMNYINLTISQTKSRFKEIAARKVSGALTKDLFLQFITQATVVNLVAAALSLTFIQLVRQPFFDLFQVRVISFHELDYDTAVFFSILLLSGIIITALYPALVAHRFSARQLLGQKILHQKRFVPSALTTIQYSVALILIALIFISSAQLRFILSKDVGINKENVVVIESPLFGSHEDGIQKLSGFSQQIQTLLDPATVSLSGRVPGDVPPYNMEIRRLGAEVFFGLDYYGAVDEEFVGLYGLKIVAGRNFQMEEPGYKLMLSDFATKRFGFPTPQDAIGAIVIPAGALEPKMEIIGVFEDFRSAPLLRATGSTEDVTGRGQCISNMGKEINFWFPERISVKLKEGQIQEFITTVGKLYNDLFPGNVFDWYFIDKYINRHYQQQQIIRNQISFFTFLAVAVACLGLLGMITNRVADKFKEISVRRILGASHVQVTVVLLDTTLKQIIIAMAIGLPIAWTLANEYLQRYTERIVLKWWHFSLPLAILLAIMFLTIGSVLWNAARSNPVEALKHE